MQCAKKCTASKEDAWYANRESAPSRSSRFSHSARRRPRRSMRPKPITLMVPYAAGGPTDIVARSLGQTMGKSLGQTIVIENAVGAGGTIAPTKLKSAAPDGYTLLLAHIGMSTAPALYRTLAFRPIEDFEHIGQVVDVPMTLIARQTMERATCASSLPTSRRTRTSCLSPTPAWGSASHLCGLLFMSAIDIELTTVPYKGTGAGDERPARCPGRSALRSDDADDAVHQGRPRQGVRDDLGDRVSTR
jgi:tripartite-type tricarboxylate transporter receptor subunit TctC